MKHWIPTMTIISIVFGVIPGFWLGYAINGTKTEPENEVPIEKIV
jgi:hypothetical protein